MTMLSLATRRGGLESKGLCDIPYKKSKRPLFKKFVCDQYRIATYKKFNPPYTVESTCMKKEFVFIVVLLPH
jgi:hypothetical protein